jgi:hypothetical protein
MLVRRQHSFPLCATRCLDCVPRGTLFVAPHTHTGRKRTTALAFCGSGTCMKPCCSAPMWPAGCRHTLVRLTGIVLQLLGDHVIAGPASTEHETYMP